MSGFVYKWINNIDGKYYIGSHKGTKTDGYIGSGIVFKQAVKNTALKILPERYFMRVMSI